MVVYLRKIRVHNDYSQTSRIMSYSIVMTSYSLTLVSHL